MFGIERSGWLSSSADAFAPNVIALLPKDQGTELLGAMLFGRGAIVLSHSQARPKANRCLRQLIWAYWRLPCGSQHQLTSLCLGCLRASQACQAKGGEA